MALPYRILVTFQVPEERMSDRGTGENGDLMLVRMFDAHGYDEYMVSEKTNQETGMRERTIEFVERF